MDIESDESERWEDFFGSSTDLTPSLITFYDKLTCNHFHEDSNGSADATKIAAEESSNNSSQPTIEKEVEVVTSSSATFISKVQSVNHSQATSNGVSAKHCNFRILSPNVQRLISNSNSTNVDRIESGVGHYHNLNNSFSSKSSKRIVAKQKLSHIPLSRNTCKLTQAGSELVETFDSSLSSNESLDNLQTPTNRSSGNCNTAVDYDKTPTNSHPETFSFDSAIGSKANAISESTPLESDRGSADALTKENLIEDIHQAEADRISEIIQRFHQMYTSTLFDKDEHIKDSMDSILENNIRELHGSNGKTTYETYNYLVRKPNSNDECSIDNANNYLNEAKETIKNEAIRTPPDSPLSSHKKLSPSSSPLLTYSRTKKLGTKSISHAQKGSRKHSPPSSPVEYDADTLTELKPPSPNNNRPNSLLGMTKGKHRPLSSSSICSTSSNSSSGSEHNHGGKANISYLASVESLADHSENENSERRGNNLTILKRACMEIIDSERTYVKDLFQVIDGYLIRWKDDASLKEDDLRTLFSNIQEIHSFNADLLDQLVEAGNDPVQIAKCFIDLKDRFNVYTTYCTSYPEAIALLTSLFKATHTNTLLTLTQKSLNHTLPLGSYLLKPVQRILKYHLLLDNLRKRCDSEEVLQAHAIMREVARNIDQVKKKLEEKSRVKEVENILDGWLGPDLTVLGELKQEGILMENNKPRHVFLFQTMLIITKPKEDERLQFKQYICRNNLMLREHLPCEPTSFNVIPYDDPRNQIKLTAKNRDQKREWTQNIKDVMLEQFDIPSRAKELVYKLGDEEDRTPDKNIWKWGSNSTTPVYLERRNQYRRSEMRNRSKMKRKTITNSTSLDGFSTSKDYANTLCRKQSMDDTMMPSMSETSTFITPQKLKPGRCNHTTGVCRCSLIRQEFENLTDQNNMKERSQSVPRIPGTGDSDEENQALENVQRKTSDSSALYKFSTLGRSKSKVGDVKVYTTKSIPKRIATIKKNKARKETSKFYMDLSDFDDTVLKITESTENLQSERKEKIQTQKSEEPTRQESPQPPVELTEEEKTEREMTKDKLKKDAEIISELLKANLNRAAKKPPKKRSLDNTSALSTSDLGANDERDDDVPPPLPSNSPPPLDIDDHTNQRTSAEEHIYESLRRNVHVPYKFSPVLNRSKSQQYYSINKVEKKSRSLPRPESDYVTLVYTESGNLKDVVETTPHITPGNEVLRNSDSNINYESMSKNKSSPTSSSQCFSSIGDLQAHEAITNRSSKNLLQRFISVKGETHVSASESSLLPRSKKASEASGIARGNKPPERRVSDVTEMCRQSIIHRQGSDAVGERMANADYVDPRSLFVNSANNSTVSLDPQRDSVFSLTSSNDSVSENNRKNSTIQEETITTTANEYFEYEENVEACLENDFRDSAVYSDDNERRQDYDQGELLEFQLSPPPLPKKKASVTNGDRKSGSAEKGVKGTHRGAPPPIPAKPLFVVTKRLSSAMSTPETNSPELKSPLGSEGKSWVLKQIENFSK
ncbi:uncharacterized protein LOC119651261 [Hermetia illucens]|uniref:uncharacterized protein LOC119651261 n=1 Tax=Hermetia illucens TaxID=343691 RepID=UPI0018CC696A|nr:uncharacterized protein LOC119651261 [Hermetia illucens]